MSSALYLKYMDRIQKACNLFSWTVKSMSTNTRSNADDYIKQIESMERTLADIKRLLIFFKNTGQVPPEGSGGNPGSGIA